jgi:hypothetical protein
MKPALVNLVSMKNLLRAFLPLVLTLGAVGQTSPQTDLGALEANVAKQFNELRVKAGMSPLGFRRDIRMRMESCSVALNGPDKNVEFDSPYALRKDRLWYTTDDPAQQNDAIVNLAKIATNYGHIAVGIWFGRGKTVSKDTFWAVVVPEHSAAHEAFWSHFYLTDDFEYQTAFNKHWKERLPDVCRSIK